MTRTFLAVELPQAARAAVSAELERLSRALPGVRWVSPESVHITLAFLGELDDERLRAAHEAAELAATIARPFTVALGGLGTFGSPRAPRVIWLGVRGDEAALRWLQQRLADALAERGFPREARPFAPHLTLARLKSRLPDEELATLRRLVSTNTGDIVRWRATELSVMKSELARTGARYTQLAGYPLEGPVRHNGNDIVPGGIE